MKKITLSFLAIVAFHCGFSQASYNMVIPANDNATSAFRAPNGTAAYAYQRTVMFIHEWEMLPMNSSSITNIGFQYTNGTGGTPVVGNFTLYMENTTDTDFLKPNNFTTIATTMTPVYIGTYTVPGSVGAATVNLALTAPFIYNGGGVYMAWSFSSAGPYATTAATVASNSAETGWLWYNASATGTLNNMNIGSYFRPALTFSAVNTATNEIEVARIQTPGKVAKLEGATQNAYVTIVNSSIGAQNNVSVTLNAVGANPYSTTSVIATMAPGAINTLTFSFPAPASGQSTITATSLFTDQNLANNIKAVTQSVTCGDVAIPQPSVPVLDYTSYTVGNGVITAFRHVTGASPSSLTAVSLVIPSFTNAANSGKDVYPVVTDAAGVIVATGNTLNIGASNMGVLQPLTFSSPVALTPNTPYLFGVGTTSTGYFPVGTISSYNIGGFYQMPLGGGAPTAVSYGYMSLQASLQFTGTSLSVVANKTVVCKQDGANTITLTTTGGANTYTWNNGAHTSSIVVTPSVAGTGTGVVVYNVAGTETVSGCKTASNSIIVRVSLCQGLATNNSNGYDLKLFPNPAVNGKSTITGLVGTNAITAYNTLGQVVFTQVTSDESTVIDLSTQPSGNYMIKITDTGGESRTLKVVNQN